PPRGAARRGSTGRTGRVAWRRSSAERRQLVDVERQAAARHRHDQPEADDDLGGGDGHDGEREDLPVALAVVARGGDQGQVGAVQHDLEREEDDQRAAPDQHAERTGREEEGGDGEVPADLGALHLERLASSWAAPREWAPRMTPPTAATSSTIEVISN